MVTSLLFGEIEIDTAAHRLLVGGVARPLGRRAFAMLVVLAERAGRLVSKDELLAAVWGRTIVDDANLHVQASTRRKALGAGVIETVAGLGYRFAPAPGRGATVAPDAVVGTIGVATGSDPGAFDGRGWPTATPPMLYGRADELAALRAMLSAHRLVTLVGIGGVGKTTLALAVCHAERPQGGPGIGCVDLAPVLDPAQVVGTVARALGLDVEPVNHEASSERLERLARACADADRLLLIDNAEHLHASVATVLAVLLARTTRLRFLVTSRRPLRLPEEQRFPLGGLAAAVVDLDAGLPSRQDVLGLFEARVRALDPRFRLTPANASTVAAICRRLDGLPLAIELAAARAPVLGVDALRERLDVSLRVLGDRPTIGSPRQQTLRAMLDWTHALLSDDERRLLRRLAVFVGGFSLDLAEAVVLEMAATAIPDARIDRDGSTFLDDLSVLIETSLIVVEESTLGQRTYRRLPGGTRNVAEPQGLPSDAPRYRLLEVTRDYAREKLVAAGEADRVARAHAHAVWRLFAAAEIDLNEKTEGSPSRGEFIRRLSPEIENLRAARA